MEYKIIINKIYIWIWNVNRHSQVVGFVEVKETANGRANIGGTIICAPIKGQ